MSDQHTAARLAFHGFGETEAAPLVSTPPPGPREEGPACLHRLHGVIPRERDEWRITTQPAHKNRSGFVSPARICIRRWHRGRDGQWWTDPRNPGISIAAAHAAEFGRAVAAAVAALTCEAKP
jgi:hypothetical protein